MLQQLGAIAAASVLAACATPDVSGVALPPLVSSAAGDYDNSAQFAAADSSQRREPAVGHPYDWLDEQHASFRWVAAPLLGEHVMYLEWRRANAAGAISRQRIWSFRRDANGAWRMDFFTLRDPQQYALQGTEAAFAALTTAQLIGYGDTCALEHTGEAGADVFRIPAACSIQARSGRAMQLRAEVRFERECLRYREAGILPDGTYAFLVPGGERLDYEFARGRARKCSSLSR